MPHSAAEHIAAAVDAAGGALRFDRFLSLALYGPGGFYTTDAADGGGRAGRRGDFITSAEVGPLFGAVLARYIDAVWDELGQPATMTVVEGGAGPGTLARSIRNARPRCLDALHYVAVEVSAAQRALHPDGVESRATMPTAPFRGVLLANELLDNIPFRLAVMDGGWREAYVVTDGDRFAEVLRPFEGDIDRDIDRLPARAAHGARAPIQVDAGEWLAGALGLLEAGRAVVIDYMSATTAGLVLRPWREWLRTYRNHQRGGH
ncbi:MAG TPA: SAM-dependent methyltransferase, partial [Ilumatobacteraceae bacterium]|nr:SAM-dependent methyltransferase [Ilumatobacteraceae bacterium]